MSVGDYLRKNRHTAEHLGEVQYIKGLLGKIGAPL